MINYYGIALILWLFVGLVGGVYKSRSKEHPVTHSIALSLRFIGMVWLVFQI